MTKQIKQIIFALIVIVIAFVGFKYFIFDSDSNATDLIAETSTPATFVDGQVILALLNKLDQVTLDDSIFSNKIFASLVSFERPIASQTKQRSNPFAPIGVNSVNTILPVGTSTIRR